MQSSLLFVFLLFAVVAIAIKPAAFQQRRATIQPLVSARTFCACFDTESRRILFVALMTPWWLRTQTSWTTFLGVPTTVALRPATTVFLLALKNWVFLKVRYCSDLVLLVFLDVLWIELNSVMWHSLLNLFRSRFTKLSIGWFWKEKVYELTIKTYSKQQRTLSFVPPFSLSNPNFLFAVLWYCSLCTLFFLQCSHAEPGCTLLWMAQSECLARHCDQCLHDHASASCVACSMKKCPM